MIGCNVRVTPSFSSERRSEADNEEMRCIEIKQGNKDDNLEDFRIDRREISIIKISHILEYDALIIIIKVYYIILNSDSNNLQ